MTVDLSELDAWAAQVQRASDDLAGSSRNGASHLIQTDFGPILETMMGAFNALIPSVHQSLEDNGTGMRDQATGNFIFDGVPTSPDAPLPSALHELQRCSSSEALLRV